MRIGVLTSGGDCAGLNAGISETLSRLESAGAQPVLVPDGFAGLQRGSTIEVTPDSLYWASRRGGSILGASRTNLKHGPALDAALQGVRSLSLDGLVVFGGDGSLQGAARLAEHLPVGAIPKTIDADVGCTEETIGFATAVQAGVDAIERIDDTRWSHRAAFVIEVMGRRSGMLAAAVALASGVDGVVVPEQPWSLEAVATRLRTSRGGIVVVSESAWSEDLGPVRLDHRGKPEVGGVVYPLADALSAVNVPNVRTVSFGHLLRGGPAVAADRLLARRFAAVAVGEVVSGRSCVAAVSGGRVVSLPVEEAFKPRRFLTAAECESLGSLLIRR